MIFRSRCWNIAQSSGINSGHLFPFYSSSIKEPPISPIASQSKERIFDWVSWLRQINNWLLTNCWVSGVIKSHLFEKLFSLKVERFFLKFEAANVLKSTLSVKPFGKKKCVFNYFREFEPKIERKCLVCRQKGPLITTRFIFWCRCSSRWLIGWPHWWIRWTGCPFWDKFEKILIMDKYKF